MLTKGEKAGILSERLTRGHENRTKSGRYRGEPGRTSERIRKKCLTNSRVRGKLNKFASEDTNEFEKDGNQAIRSEKL